MESTDTHPRCERDIAVIHANMKALEAAIQHQAIEYERRLTELNHAHAQGLVDKAKFLTSDMFYAKLESLDKDSKEAEKWRISIDVWRSRQSGVIIGVAAVAGIISGIISTAGALWALSK